MLKAIKSAGKSLMRTRMRAALTIIAISIGVFAIIVISAVSEYGTRAINDELSSLGLDGISVTCQTNGVSRTLGDPQLSVIREQDFVEAAAPISSRMQTIVYRDQQTECVTWGIDGSAGDIVCINVLYGRKITDEEAATGAKVCMVDTTVSQAIYRRDNIVGKHIQIRSDNGKTESYEVVGVAEAGSGLLESFMGSVVPSFVYVPITAISPRYDQISVKIKSGEDIDTCGEIIESLFNDGNDYFAENLAKQRGVLNSIMDIVALILTLISGISLIVAGMGVMTVMTVSVSERRREIGIKKAIGAKRGRIMFEFLLEALFISAIGCIAGVAFGWAVSYAGAKLAGISVVISENIVLFAVIFSMFTGLLFGVYPAVKASRLNPVDALRRAGD